MSKEKKLKKKVSILACLQETESDFSFSPQPEMILKHMFWAFLIANTFRMKNAGKKEEKKKEKKKPRWEALWWL